MRVVLVVLMSLFLFSGCVMLSPKVTNVADKNMTKVVLEQNVSTSVAVLEEEVVLMENVFDDELYFEKDKVGKDKTKVVIQYLDALAWEKRILNEAYWESKKLWSKEQSRDFRKILEEDKYLSLCGEHRYWDNLEFEESEPERDVLHSILLIKYLNNLANGCPKWVEFKIKNENTKEFINTKHVFSLLPHDVIIKKLFSLYVPKSKKFSSLIERDRTTLSLDERLKIEMFKREENYPKYKKK